MPGGSIRHTARVMAAEYVKFLAAAARLGFAARCWYRDQRHAAWRCMLPCTQRPRSDRARLTRSCCAPCCIAVAFYVVTAIFLLGGSWLFFAPALLGDARAAPAWAVLHLALEGHLPRAHGGARRRQAATRPCLVVAKHQSAWDTFALVPVFRDPAIVLKEELKWIPFYGWFCVKFEHILVRRDRAAAALKQMVADARHRAGQGREVFIFPEGTRRPPGAAPDYKPGYVALYEGLGLPCFPARPELRPLLAPPQLHALSRHHRRRDP